MKIPFIDFKRQYAELETEINKAVKRVLKSGSYILGAEVEAFENEWAEFCQAKAAVTVNNGTDALSLTLIATEAVREGSQDEIITTPLTAAYTALAIKDAGGIPIFADIDAQTFTLDANSVEKQITEKTRAILPVHLYGQTADMTALKAVAEKYDLIFIEDAAQAHGATFAGKPVGSFGVATCFSFYPTKNLGAYGDGGAITSNDDEIIEKLYLLRQGGSLKTLQTRTFGSRNTRLDELQAAILRVKLPYLRDWTKRRQYLAQIYFDNLQNSELILPLVREDSNHVFHLFVVQSEQREKLRTHLAEKGIETVIHYPYLLHQQPLFYRKAQPKLPVVEYLADKIFSLPLNPQLTESEIERICEAIFEI